MDSFDTLRMSALQRLLDDPSEAQIAAFLVLLRAKVRSNGCEGANAAKQAGSYNPCL